MIFGFFKRPAADLAQGEEIELEQVLSHDGAQKEVYVTEVISITKKEIVLIAPMKQKEVVVLEPGTEIIVHFTRDDQIGTFNSAVLLEEISGHPPVLVLAQPANVVWEEKQETDAQRRQFVRLDVSLPIEFRLPSGISRQAVTNDISGSGLSMVTVLSLDINSMVRLKLEVQNKKIDTEAKVIRCEPMKLHPAAKDKFTKYEVALNFVNMPAPDQDSIIRYIFDRQRELRQRGLM